MKQYKEPEIKISIQNTDGTGNKNLTDKFNDLLQNTKHIAIVLSAKTAIQICTKVTKNFKNSDDELLIETNAAATILEEMSEKSRIIKCEILLDQ